MGPASIPIYKEYNGWKKIQDVHDGEEYLKLTELGGFLTVHEHIGLILCADGVQLFSSAKQLIWPILLSITSPGVCMNAKTSF